MSKYTLDAIKNNNKKNTCLFPLLLFAFILYQSLTRPRREYHCRGGKLISELVFRYFAVPLHPNKQVCHLLAKHSADDFVQDLFFGLVANHRTMLFI